jgi:hypothetical protein
MRQLARIAVVVTLAVGGHAMAALPSNVQFVVLQVTFKDFPAGSRFTTAQTQTNFNNIATLWGNDTSYGNITLSYQFAGPNQMPSNSTTYLDQQSGQFSSSTAVDQIVKDAVAASPNTINWNSVYGVVVAFADNRTTGFYRGITLPGTVAINPPGGGTFNVHRSLVGENPTEDVARAWGRWAHEMGHQMQQNPGNPWHPSNYNSNFEQMDGEYPAQSGVFNKEANMAYPGWLPPGKYKIVTPPEGASVGLLAEERPPSFQPDFQAIKASLTVGGPQLYYLVSVRHHIIGDDLATTHGPSGIPDEGVLIERVLEGGDPTIDDCSPNGCFRWVNVQGNGNANTLWHVGDTFKSAADGINITVRQKPDDDHYIVDVFYADKSGQPDVGLQSWLQPPGNTYETTDIWVDSPLNGYGTYRYGTWSDLLGSTVPVGNGDDPAVGQVNRIYARVRNYGSVAATDVVAHFDVTDPPGLGINGSNGFKELGKVDKTQFPGLASIPASGHVDVYIEWTPNITLTPQQIQQGRFFFHTCVRVRLDHVAGETFFANQDGNGQQENIDYFQAGAGGSPGAPGPADKDVIRLRNDNPSVGKEFVLTLLRDDLPASWKVDINGGNSVVQLGPNQIRDIPVTVQQTVAEPVGSHHAFRVMASSHVTLRREGDPDDVHDEFKPLGGVQMQVAVLRKPVLRCSARGGVVRGAISGVDERDKEVHVLVSGIAGGRILPNGVLGRVAGGRFQVDVPKGASRAVCLYGGSTFTASAGSAVFATR